MFRIIADKKTIMALAHLCGTLHGCEGCILHPFCKSEGCFFHETSFVYEAHDESAILTYQLNPDEDVTPDSKAQLLFGNQ